jgi:predicted DNA-binding transcriptional regulator AlpA
VVCFDKGLRLNRKPHDAFSGVTEAPVPQRFLQFTLRNNALCLDHSNQTRGIEMKNTENPATTIYLSGVEVRERYRCSYQTIWRWINNPEMGFPKPMKINGRNYFMTAELEAFDRRHMA